MATRTLTTQEAEARRYTVEEVGEVIRMASPREGNLPAVRAQLTYAELTQVAKELGIDEVALRAAIPEAGEVRRRARRRTTKKLRFWRHLFSYLIISGGLTLFDWVGDNTFGWAYYPAVIWGILLTMHGFSAYVTGKGGALHESIYRKELEAERSSN